MTIIDLPHTPGTYVLWVRLEQPLSLVVGSLGKFQFRDGLYAYVGSAHGAGGLRARVNRHLRADKLAHWHIDRITAYVPVVAVWWVESMEKLECRWAQQLVLWGTVPAARFGASDCACLAHLIALDAEVIPRVWASLGEPNMISILGGNPKADRPAEH